MSESQDGTKIKMGKECFAMADKVGMAYNDEARSRSKGGERPTLLKQTHAAYEKLEREGTLDKQGREYLDELSSWVYLGEIDSRFQNGELDNRFQSAVNYWKNNGAKAEAKKAKKGREEAGGHQGAVGFGSGPNCGLALFDGISEMLQIRDVRTMPRDQRDIILTSLKDLLKVERDRYLNSLPGLPTKDQEKTIKCTKDLTNQLMKLRRAGEFPNDEDLAIHLEAVLEDYLNRLRQLRASSEAKTAEAARKEIFFAIAKDHIEFLDEDKERLDEKKEEEAKREKKAKEAQDRLREDRLLKIAENAQETAHTAVENQKNFASAVDRVESEVKNVGKKVDRNMTETQSINTKVASMSARKEPPSEDDRYMTPQRLDRKLDDAAESRGSIERMPRSPDVSAKGADKICLKEMLSSCEEGLIQELEANPMSKPANYKMGKVNAVKQSNFTLGSLIPASRDEVVEMLVNSMSQKVSRDSTSIGTNPLTLDGEGKRSMIWLNDENNMDDKGVMKWAAAALGMKNLIFYTFDSGDSGEEVVIFVAGEYDDAWVKSTHEAVVSFISSLATPLQELAIEGFDLSPERSKDLLQIVYPEIESESLTTMLSSGDNMEISFSKIRFNLRQSSCLGEATSKLSFDQCIFGDKCQWLREDLEERRRGRGKLSLEFRSMKVSLEDLLLAAKKNLVGRLILNDVTLPPGGCEEVAEFLVEEGKNWMLAKNLDVFHGDREDLLYIHDENDRKEIESFYATYNETRRFVFKAPSTNKPCKNCKKSLEKNGRLCKLHAKAENRA